MLGNFWFFFDFFEIVVADNLNLREIKQLIINSIMYSASCDYEKEKSLKNWKINWQHFINNYYVKIGNKKS